MKPATITIDGVRYVRARAIESEVKAIEHAAARVLYDHIPNQKPARLLHDATRRLMEVVADNPDSEPLPDVVAYHDDSFDMHHVAGRGIVLATIRATSPVPKKGDTIRWRGDCYLVRSVETSFVDYRWAIVVRPKESTP